MDIDWERLRATILPSSAPARMSGDRGRSTPTTCVACVKSRSRLSGLLTLQGRATPQGRKSDSTRPGLSPQFLDPQRLSQSAIRSGEPVIRVPERCRSQLNTHIGRHGGP